MQRDSGTAQHATASLSPERWRDVLDAADRAMELGEEERRAFLQRLSQVDTALGSMLEELLASPRRIIDDKRRRSGVIPPSLNATALAFVVATTTDGPPPSMNAEARHESGHEAAHLFVRLRVVHPVNEADARAAELEQLGADVERRPGEHLTLVLRPLADGDGAAVVALEVGRREPEPREELPRRRKPQKGAEFRSARNPKGR